MFQHYINRNEIVKNFIFNKSFTHLFYVDHENSLVYRVNHAFRKKCFSEKNLYTMETEDGVVNNIENLFSPYEKYHGAIDILLELDKLAMPVGDTNRGRVYKTIEEVLRLKWIDRLRNPFNLTENAPIFELLSSLMFGPRSEGIKRSYTPQGKPILKTPHIKSAQHKEWLRNLELFFTPFPTEASLFEAFITQHLTGTIEFQIYKFDKGNNQCPVLTDKGIVFFDSGDYAFNLTRSAFAYVRKQISNLPANPIRRFELQFIINDYASLRQFNRESIRQADSHFICATNPVPGINICNINRKPERALLFPKFK